MTRVKFIFTFCLALCLTVAKGENVSVTGRVTDEQNAPLMGANVLVKGNVSSGTITDLDGNYAITVDTENTAETVLTFSYLGYDSVDVAVGNKSVINAQLKSESTELNEVVVTALGIKREEKALGYATSNVDSESISSTSPTNWSSSLNGKVAGLSFASGGGPNGSSRISLRGDNSMSLTGNDALIIVDGVPINNKIRGTGFSSYMGDDNAVDFGNRMGDLNPDDIESVTVLKGPSAAALYGSRAANGVLIVTTKSGSTTKGVGVSFNASFAFDEVLHFPHYQYEYGEGSNNVDYYSYGDSEDGDSTIATATFGPKFDANKMFYQYNPNDPNGIPTERTPWVAYKDNRKQFFNGGATQSYNVSIEAANDNNSGRVALGYTDNEWVMPNTGYMNLTLSSATNHQISHNLKITSRFNYSQKNNNNIPVSGYNNHTIGYMMLFLQPNYDMNWYRQNGYWKEKNVTPLRVGDPLVENPYLIAYEMTNSSLRRSFTTSVTATYTFSPKLELLVRNGIDNSNETREQQRPYGIQRYPTGMYREQLLADFEVNTDALLTYRTNWGLNSNVTISAGGNSMQSKYRSMIGYANKLAVPGIYNLANSKDAPTITADNVNKGINSVYALVNYSYKDLLFVDVTARNDWSSTLPDGNNSYFYPSVTASTLLNEVVKLPKFVDLLKVRGSWAQVGNDALPYKTSKYYAQGNFSGSVVNPTVLYNNDLKPEITSSYEFGIDGRMLNSRLAFDVTYYNSISKNQILDMALANESGYVQATMNAGKIQNKGVEIMLSGSPIRTHDFQWDVSVNWSTNKNKVLSLADGMDYQPIGEADGAAYIRAKVGGSTGDMYGYKFERTDSGEIIYKEDGTPKLSTDLEYIGNVYAKWKGGFTNNIRYKNVTLGFQFDGQYGAKMYSQSHHKMSQRGRLDHTLAGREEGFIIGDGVVENGDGTYSPNTVKLNPQKYYDQFYRRDNAESNTLDASFLKLRELSLTYSFPKAIANKLSLRDLNVTFFGRNLFMVTSFPIYDPETAQLGDGSLTPGVEMGQLPTTRTMGVSFKTSF